MKGAVFIDNWKFKLFRKRLKGAGYTFKVYRNYPSPGVMLLQVETDDTLKLQKLVEITNDECRRTKSTTH